MLGHTADPVASEDWLCSWVPQCPSCPPAAHFLPPTWNTRPQVSAQCWMGTFMHIDRKPREARASVRDDCSIHFTNDVLVFSCPGTEDKNELFNYWVVQGPCWIRAVTVLKPRYKSPRFWVAFQSSILRSEMEDFKSAVEGTDDYYCDTNLWFHFASCKLRQRGGGWKSNQVTSENR